jgi:hypothetical protein
MLIAPHAGYVYSGPVAAPAYGLLADIGGPHSRVVLLGPSHFERFDGLASSGARALATPLGRVEVDPELTEQAEGHYAVARRASAHASEHSLEVHLPFLQVALDDLSVLALVTGEVDPVAVADVLDGLLDDPVVIALISSDLSHYLDYPTARRRDARTAQRIAALQPEEITWGDACGRTAIQAALLVARRRNWGCRLLDLRNSGDTAGGSDRVVGYGAFAIGPSR